MLKSTVEEPAFIWYFHGGSGLCAHEIHEALDYGVVKMNVDTDRTLRSPRCRRSMIKIYDSVPKVDGEEATR